MDIEIDQVEQDISVVRVKGRLDSAGVDRGELRFSAAVVAPGRNAAIDLTDVSFVASMGIRLFITSARALNQKGRRMVIFGAQELVQEVLDNVALDQIVPIVASRDAALAELATG